MKALMILLGMVVLAVSGVADAGRVKKMDLKGLVIGEKVSPEQVQKAFDPPQAAEWADAETKTVLQKIHNDNRVKCGEGHKGSQVCNGNTTVAGVQVESNIVIGASGRLIRVWMSFDRSQFRAVLKAARTKYGKPSAVKRTGNGKVYVWRGNRKQGVRLLLQEDNDYRCNQYGCTDRSLMWFTTKEDQKMWDAAENADVDDI